MPKQILYREVMITGFGGQGVILAGNILGKAATIFDKRHATLIQSYGPEARGGACAAQVVISDEPIEYPYVEHPHVLICMSQEGFDKHISRLAKGGILFTDSGLVKVNPEDLPKGSAFYSIPATSLAEKMGVKMMANIIMLGFAASVARLVSPDALRKAVLASVPKGTEEKNVSGLEAGFAYAAKSKTRGPRP